MAYPFKIAIYHIAIATLIVFCLSDGGAEGERKPSAMPVGINYTPDPVPSLGEGATYYISPSGNDANDGEAIARAWQTLSKVNQTSFAPGDAILLQGGKSFFGTLKLGMDDAGTAINPVSISSYGNGRALIDGGAGSGISVHNAGGVQIFKINIVGRWNVATQNGNGKSGIQVINDLRETTKLDHVIIDRVEVSGFKEAGIMLEARADDQTKSGYTNVRISNCSVHDNGDAGIMSWGPYHRQSTAYAHKNIVVRGCHVFNNRGIINKGLHSGNGIVLADVDGAMIEFNVVYNNGENNNFSGGGPVGIWAWDANAVTIQFNESYGNKSGTFDGGGFDLDGGTTNSVMQYNYSHDNAGPGYQIAQFPYARRMDKNTLRYNISENDCRDNPNCGAINFWNGGSGINNTLIHHNIVFLTNTNQTVSAVQLINNTYNTHVNDNIFATKGNAALIKTTGEQIGVQFIDNVYWSSDAGLKLIWSDQTHKTLAAFHAATGLLYSLGIQKIFHHIP